MRRKGLSASASARRLRAALPIYVFFLVTITFTIFFPARRVVGCLPKHVIRNRRLLQFAIRDGYNICTP